MNRHSQIKVITAGLFGLLLLTGSYYAIVRPYLAARAIVGRLASSNKQEQQQGLDNLMETKRMGIGKFIVKRQLRTMLMDVEDSEIRPLLTALAQFAYRGSGVDMMADHDDQQLVLEAVARQQRYAKEHGYSPLHAGIADDGRLYIVPTITMHREP